MSIVHVVGGGSANDLLNQLTAEATGLDVVAGPVEATATGNLLVQAAAMGDLPSSLSALREVAAASSDLVVWHPGVLGVTEDQWRDAEQRVTSSR